MGLKLPLILSLFHYLCMLVLGLLCGEDTIWVLWDNLQFDIWKI